MTLGLLWVYEGGFGSFGAHFGIALGVAGEALGILVRIVGGFLCPQEALGPSQGVQGCTREAPRRHQGGTREAPRMPQGKFCTSTWALGHTIFKEYNLQHITVDQSAFI